MRILVESWLLRARGSIPYMALTRCTLPFRSGTKVRDGPLLVPWTRNPSCTLLSACSHAAGPLLCSYTIQLKSPDAFRIWPPRFRRHVRTENAFPPYLFRKGFPVDVE